MATSRCQGKLTTAVPVSILDRLLESTRLQLITRGKTVRET